MPELNDPALATPSDAGVFYALHRLGSRLVSDYLLSSYLVETLQLADGLGPTHKLMLAAGGRERGVPDEQIQALIARQDDTLKWVAEVKAEGFHRTNVLAFLSLWAAHETGHENALAAAIMSVRSAAESAAQRMKPGKYDIAVWPWPEEECLGLAQRIDQKAKDALPERGWDAAGRLMLVYEWLGAKLVISSETASAFNEASMVRNVLLHRYGRLGPRDIARAPHLADRENGAIQITGERLRCYYEAIAAMLIAAMNAAAEAGWR